MTDLSDFRTKIRIILGDTDAERYDDDVLNQTLRWALDTFSKALPQVKSETIALISSGREQSLALLNGVLNILEVEYPYEAGRESLNVLPQWYFYRREGNTWLYLGGNRVPQAGDIIHVTYAARHTLTGLEDAATTTVPAVYETLLENGAAGKAIMIRGFQLIETYGKKSEEPDKLKAWSEELLAEFSEDLLALRSGQVLRGALSNGWTLDRWDACR